MEKYTQRISSSFSLKKEERADFVLMGMVCSCWVARAIWKTAIAFLMLYLRFLIDIRLSL